MTTTEILYDRILNKINYPNASCDVLQENINNLSSDSYKIMAYRALYKAMSAEDYAVFKEEYYKVMQKNKDKNNVGVLPMTLDQLRNIVVSNKNKIRQIIDSFVIYINTHYPLRLDYYNLRIYYSIEDNPTETNYMTYIDGIIKFHLNSFKNVRFMGPQVITYDDDRIRQYMADMTDYLGHPPEYLLYRWYNKYVTSFSCRITYGAHIQRLFKKYIGLAISMNDIRKIHESALIQSPEYIKMNNVEKNNLHRKLLHSRNTAQATYNIVS